MAKTYAHVLPPRFEVGDKIDKLTVIGYLGFYGKGRQKRQHQYQLECACGTVLERSQEALVRKSKGQMQQFGKSCDSCRKSMLGQARWTKSAVLLDPVESAAARGLAYVMKTWPVPD